MIFLNRDGLPQATLKSAKGPMTLAHCILTVIPPHRRRYLSLLRLRRGQRYRAHRHLHLNPKCNRCILCPTISIRASNNIIPCHINHRDILLPSIILSLAVILSRAIQAHSINKAIRLVLGNPILHRSPGQRGQHPPRLRSLHSLCDCEVSRVGAMTLKIVGENSPSRIHVWYPFVLVYPCVSLIFYADYVPFWTICSLL